jgi:hypothetical protein
MNRNKEGSRPQISQPKAPVHTELTQNEATKTISSTIGATGRKSRSRSRVGDSQLVVKGFA